MPFVKQSRSRRPLGRAGHAGIAGAVVVTGIVLVLAAAVFSGCGSDATGETAPAFSGVTLGGEEVSLSGYRGKPLVLAFMASW